MRTTFLLAILLFLRFVAFGQQNADTAAFVRTGHSHGWSANKNALRVGLGLQKAFYAELGFSRQKCNYSDVGFYTRGYYVAMDWTPAASTNEPVYGLKAGYEIDSMIGALGLEAKYQTDFNKKNVVLTPKIGLGLLGDLILYYGYNVPVGEASFAQIGPHQFSLICNLHRRFLRY